MERMVRNENHVQVLNVWMEIDKRSLVLGQPQIMYITGLGGDDF